MQNTIDFMLFFFLLSLCLHFEPTFQQLRSRTERTALLELRSSLGLRSRDWPIKADPCAAWNGIQCLNGRVVGINVSGFRRTRIGRQTPRFAVDSLTNFTLLQSFNASNLLLPGPIPTWFGSSLESLQVLDLRSCSIIGPIPSSFGNLTNLTNLYLSKNQLNGSIPTSFSQLIRLSVLDLSSNGLDGSIPPLIGSLRQLQSLNLSNNNITSSLPASLGDLDKLTVLDLGFNRLTGSIPQDLKGMSNLQRMVISNNMLGGSLQEDLFSSLKQLHELILNNNELTGEVPDAFFLTLGLRVFDISGNKFTGMLPNSSSNSNSTGRRLDISRNMFYGRLMPVIGRFSDVDLSRNYFEGRVPNFVPINASLQSNCLQNVSSQKTVEECSSFYSEKGIDFDDFGQPNTAQPPLSNESGKNKNYRWVVLLANLLGGLGFIVLI